jgi:hypothetical protein
VHRLEIASKEQGEAHDVLAAGVHKLRGQFFGGQRRGSERSTLDTIPVGDKESLRAYAGIGAGRAHHHQE